MNIRKLHLVIMALLVVPMVLSACATPIQAPSTTATPTALASTAADAEPLPMPRYIAPAYTTLGTRNADGNPGPNYWQNHSVHDIAIEVAPPGRTVTGTETITYTNNSPNALPMVVVRLYQNSRLPEAMREENHTRDFLTDGIQIEEYSVNGQVMPWATYDAILPFETVKLVPLPQPILPGESATFTFKWHYDLGLEYNREGVFDPTTFFIGYFFPRISTYSDTDAGLLPGWDLEEYTYRSGRELHNDFADFNYSVTVPKNFLVWATGELQNPDEVLQPDAAQRLLESRTSDEIINIASPDDLQQGLITAQTDTVTWRWKAENITDIALGVSDHYVWDAGSVVADPATDRRVSVHAAYAEEFAGFDRMAQDVKEIVASVSSNWPGVPWPYSHAIVFVGGGDEEFPMMANDGPEAPEGISVRLIAAHELLHNYFPFYMGIDERRYPFMDEGWTTAFEYLFNLEDIGKEAADAIFIAARSGNLVKPYAGEEIPIIMPADATRGLVTGKDGYEKPALAYLALKEYMGDDAFKTSLHAFIDRWNGKRPLPWDMFNAFNDTSDLDLNWFFQNWFFESNYLDIALGDVQAVDDGYAIQVKNVGGAAVPFDVKVVYADDSEESLRQGPGVWQDSSEETTVTITTDKELKSVTLDGGIFVDGNVADNTWSSEPAADAETAAPTATEAAEAPAPVPPPTDELVMLRANPWQWVSFTSPVETFEVETPGNYTVAFNTDASLAITADCNSAAGSYQGEGGKLTVEIGPMTAAACPPESRSDQFVKLLGSGALYFFRDGNLTIDLFADGGTMVFAPASGAPEANTSTMEASNTPRLRELDFTPFEEELAAFTPERAAAVDAIVKDADIAQVQDAVKAGKLTYSELTLYFLAHIQQYDETLRTMIELNPDALKEAQAADQLLKDGKATGLMFGIPVTLKDNIETAAPMHTTGGAEILLNNQPKADASFVKQLRDAGAVILGKANLSELAGGVSSNAGSSAVAGQVVNPHGNYSPAGSSAGSGAGTAAYETMVSVGSETSGSLIAPASYNGVVGMYPGHGVVDGANVIPLIKNNDSAGPMGRNVKDVAALLAVIDTQDTDYVAGLDAKALNGVNAAFLKSDVLAQKPSELEDSSDNAAIAQLVEKSLAQAGAMVTDIELTPAGISTQFNLGAILVGGVRHDMISYLVDVGAPINSLEDLAAYNLKEPDTRIPYGQGTIDAALPVAELEDARFYEDVTKQVKEIAIATLDAAFADNKADVLVSVNNYHSSFYATANYPAISVPLGLRANGMPVGVTLIGKPGSEAKLLSYAYALEQATKLRVDPVLPEGQRGENASVTQPESQAAGPEYVTALEAAYGAPSQAGFGSAVFYEPLKASDKLDQAALAKYKYFVGDLWQRYGEDAWMGPWKMVYTRPADGKRDIVAELRGITDREARMAVENILDNVDDPEKARAALSAAFDDSAVTELAVYGTGDGAAMSGLLLAGRRGDAGEATFLVFLMD